MAKRTGFGLVVAVLVCFGGMGGEQVLGGVSFPFYDSFENIDLQDYPDENGWQIMYSGVSASVSDDVAHTGSKSFHLDATTWGRVDYVNIGPPNWTSNNLTYEVSVFIEAGIETMGWLGFANPKPGDNAAIWNAFFIDTRGGVNEITFGTWYHNPSNRPPSDPLINVGTYTPGTWVTLRADLDFDSLQGNLWQNGELKVSGVPIKPKEWTHPEWGYVVSNRWVIACGGGSMGGKMYIDDVNLTPAGHIGEIESFEIHGLNEIAENSQGQYKAIAVFDNNTTRNVPISKFLCYFVSVFNVYAIYDGCRVFSKLQPLIHRISN